LFRQLRELRCCHDEFQYCDYGRCCDDSLAGFDRGLGVWMMWKSRKELLATVNFALLTVGLMLLTAEIVFQLMGLLTEKKQMAVTSVGATGKTMTSESNGR
jgi:hypothetical protein